MLVVAGTGAGLTGFAPGASAALGGGRLPRHRPARRLRLRRRALRRRRRRRDRLPGRRRGRGGGDRRSRQVAAACWRRSPRRSRSSPCWRWSTCSAAPTPTSPARSSTPAASETSPTSPSGASSSRPAASAGRSCSSSCRSCWASGCWPICGATGCGPGCATRPALRAGLLGALAATAIGTLANDSGALLLEIGTAYLLVFTGFAWAESPGVSAEGAESDEKLQFRAPHV